MICIINSERSKLNNSIITIVIVISIFWCVGCIADLPHDNPNDPLSPSYSNHASVNGKVSLIGLPNISLPGAMVKILPDNISTHTDSTGKYSIGNLEAGKKLICFSKQAFADESLHVDIFSGKENVVNVSMNGLPIITNMRVLTRKIDQLWPGPDYFAQVQANVTDPNGVIDIDSVWFSVDDINFPMAYAIGKKLFEAEIFSYHLPFNTLEWLVGKPLLVVAIDQSNGFSISTPFYVSRLIEAQALPFSPTANDTIYDSLVMQWTSPTITYNFTYSLSIVRIHSGTQIVIWTKDLLASYLKSYKYPNTLQAGNYFWTITIVDEYGNWSRSKESVFIVK